MPLREFMITIFLSAQYDDAEILKLVHVEGLKVCFGGFGSRILE